MSNTSKQLVVVGAGVAGCACAIEAAKLGLKVTVIDEHPQSTASMSLDAPYFYGARLAPKLQDASAVADTVLGTNEALMQALEADVEVLTGTCVWGVFRPDAGNPATRGRQIGLADEERSWIANYDYLVLATGARDLVLSFPGWQLPGVLGVKAATALLERYEALGGGRLVVLGSSNLGLKLALAALDAGIAVAGIVEPSDHILGDAGLAGQLLSRGVAFHLSHTVRSALGTNEVGGILIAPAASGPDTANDIEIACDTICMAYGAVPNIELPSVAGCAVEYRAARGGWVPAVDAHMRSSNAHIYVIGDAAGVSDSGAIDPAIAQRQGEAAARAIAVAAGLGGDAGAEAPVAETEAFPPVLWLDSLLAASGMDVMLCQCEDVTRRELIGVVPPRYLEAAVRAPAHSPNSLGATGRLSQDLFKRLTRVGMGHCQGRRCRDHGALLIAREAGAPLEAVRPGSYRVPVRPLSLKVMWADDETDEERANWTTWLHEVDDPIPEAR